VAMVVDGWQWGKSGNGSGRVAVAEKVTMAVDGWQQGKSDSGSGWVAVTVV
jgi:hypothetical protein